MRSRAERTREQIEGARGDSRVIDTALSTVEHDVASGGGVLAGAVAFRIFMVLVPYVFTVVAGLGFAADASGRSPREAARAAGIGGLIAQSIASVGDASTFERLTVLVVGAVSLFLAARSAVKVLAIVHALLWRLPIVPTARAGRKALVLVGLITFALLLVNVIAEARAASLVGGAVVMVLYTGVIVGMWLLVTWHLPRPAQIRWTGLLPGAVLFAVGCQVLHVVTVVWIAYQVSSKSETYGAIGAALAILLWAFLMGRLITAAAELNAIVWWRGHPERWADAGTTAHSPRTGDDDA